MELFLDSAEIEEIKIVKDYGLLDGVTTNPSLAAKEGTDFDEVTKEILKRQSINSIIQRDSGQEMSGILS